MTKPEDIQWRNLSASERAARKCTFHRAFTREKRLSPQTRLVGQLLADYVNCDPDNVLCGYAWPSVATLASELGVNERTIRAAIAKLSAPPKGAPDESPWFVIEKRRPKGSRYPHNIYKPCPARMAASEVVNAPVKEAATAGEDMALPDENHMQKTASGSNSTEKPYAKICMQKTAANVVEVNSVELKSHSLTLSAEQEGTQANNIEILGPEESPPDEGPFRFVDNLTGELKTKPIRDLTWEDTQLALTR